MSAAGVGFRSERGPVLIALMVSLGLVALDSTVLATGVPSIVESLGGFASFPWLLSAHLPAQAVSASVYSKLTDTLGRKPVMPAGIGTFMSGSILAGLAWRMPVLINCRTIQRFGAGAIQPNDRQPNDRPRLPHSHGTGQGPELTLRVWAIAAAFPLMRAYHENVPRRMIHIDYPGAILPAAGMSLGILAVLEGGQVWASDSVLSIGGFTLGGRASSRSC